MIDVSIGSSAQAHLVSAVSEAFGAARSGLRNSEKIDLAIVFATSDIPSQPLLKCLQPLLGETNILCVQGQTVISRRGIEKHAVAILLGTLAEGTYCTTAFIKDIKTPTDASAGQELGEKLLYGFKNIPRNFGLLFFDAHAGKNAAGFIAGLQEHLGKSFPCMGGSVADNLNAVSANVFVNTEAVNNGCAGILWGGKINFGFGIRHGWKPLGKPHAVTESWGNIIQTIDGRVAVSLYEDYLACDRALLKKDIGRLSLFYPIGLSVPGENGYILRNVVALDDSGFLICQSEVPKNSTARLMISTRETCLDAVSGALEEAEQGLESSFSRPAKEQRSRFALVFDSAARGALHHHDTKETLAMLHQRLGPDTPFVGLATASEIAPLKMSDYRGQIYFHNQSTLVVLIEGQHV